MRQADPEGAELRRPDLNRRLLERQPLRALGPYHQHHADGHEKMADAALKMGDFAFPIYGIRDQWTGYLHALECLPNARDRLPNARDRVGVADVFLRSVESTGSQSCQLSFVVCVADPDSVQFFPEKWSPMAVQKRM